MEPLSAGVFGAAAVFSMCVGQTAFGVFSVANQICPETSKPRREKAWAWSLNNLEGCLGEGLLCFVGCRGLWAKKVPGPSVLCREKNLRMVPRWWCVLWASAGCSGVGEDREERDVSLWVWSLCIVSLSTLQPWPFFEVVFRQITAGLTGVNFTQNNPKFSSNTWTFACFFFSGLKE